VGPFFRWDGLDELRMAEDRPLFRAEPVRVKEESLVLGRQPPF